jgi:hypothetical protein
VTAEELIAQADSAAANAYAPYSDYEVGAAVLARDGRVFAAANVENAAYPLGICAERAAIGKAASEGLKPGDVEAIAIFVEPGNAWLRDTNTPIKPTVVMLPGDAIESLPRGMPYGHTGTILGEDDPKLIDVRRQLVAQGMKCTDRFSEFLDHCESL